MAECHLDLVDMDVTTYSAPPMTNTMSD